MTINTQVVNQRVEEFDKGTGSPCEETLVRVDGVSKRFCRSLKKSLWYGVKDVASELNPFHRGTRGDTRSPLRPDEFWAVDEVSFEVRRGECIGLIGHNGAGKTTLLKMLNGLIKPDAGRIEMHGRVGALIALGAGFNPILTGRENIYVNGSVLGLSKREIDDKLEEIIDFSELREFIDMPVQSYSSGMSVRLGFAVATALKPDVLILDEVLAVGDAAFKTKCFTRLSKLMKNAAIIFVSHSEEQIRRVCQRGLLLRRGAVVVDGSLDECFETYRRDMPVSSVDVGVNYLAESVNSVRIQPIIDSHRSGEDLGINIFLDAARTETLSLNVLALFNESGEAVAVVDLLSVMTRWEIGENAVRMAIRTLSLRPGRYSFGIEMVSDRHAETLVRMRFEESVQVFGSIVHWCPYTPPAIRAIG